MSDIYKQRPPMPAAKPRPSRRRRRSTADGTFDENKPRRRRSRNSGLRRLVHLFRKDENERTIWVSALVIALLVLVAVGLWQFWYREQQVRKKTREQEQARPVQRIPRSPESAAE